MVVMPEYYARLKIKFVGYNGAEDEKEPAFDVFRSIFERDQSGLKEVKPYKLYRKNVGITRIGVIEDVPLPVRIELAIVASGIPFQNSYESSKAYQISEELF